ncbi:mfs transporter : Membrane protein, major facilitator superfamily OS=Geobacter bemidjiensis (strain Bem / ATCC BAA-1014 / DSM 16622) GN=Gbem_2215 PE=4 SV=1: MFS_1 [Gemmata massiliana]|uniref:Major facilitator superfamily (MFS) profile domain-containing protein n=1 Tax=Gemmata massiliana TaxID=1210884 RepID=A0A6P2CUC5_9BACT|nr:MFS transporter [Gemmata massiliana]VTR90790.1 mfs transporter : Membrane protein, major facilitator superfamily OS=Geobacter bemidjiensis (strain Bem / ATCC BAA-1014 / DSM 16622) GN=Gbem_2215 PE=4 SV=1: MFS_1 [Gemmata massiliana]
MHTGTATNSTGPDQPVPGARSALVLLIVINLFNYIDRQVLSAVLPRLQLDGTIIDPNDPDPNFKLGLLTSAFMVTYMLGSPLFGWLDGRGVRRWMILGIGVTLWSLASGFSGFATGYAMLLATRCLVGIGEAAYAPVASAMLSDAYPARQRGPVLAGFNMAIPVGSALGFGIGGLISGITGDWRPAFWFTFSGLILGAVCFARKELPRPAAVSEEAHPSYGAVLKKLTRIRSFVMCCAGMTAITFVIGGVGVWVPVYFFQREARFEITEPVLKELEKQLPAQEVNKLRPLADGTERAYPEMKKLVAGALGENAKAHAEKVFLASATPASPNPATLPIIFGAILVLGGLAATAAGAWLGEKLRARGVRGAYFLVIGGGAAFAVPSFLGILYTPLPLSWVFTFLTIFGLFLHVGPGNTILANVVRSDIRGTAFAINVLVIHALGDVISPPLIGAIGDATSLQFAFALTTVVIAVGAVLWFWGAKYLDEDTAKAESL